MADYHEPSLSYVSSGICVLEILQMARPAISSIESLVIEFLEKLILHSSPSTKSQPQKGENESASALKNKIKLNLVSRSNRSSTKWIHSTFLNPSVNGAYLTPDAWSILAKQSVEARVHLVLGHVIYAALPINKPSTTFQNAGP